MIFVTVHTEGENCQIELSNKIGTIVLKKHINPFSKPNLSIFVSIIKGTFLLLKKELFK